MKIAVESWDPEYGSPMAHDALEPSRAKVETGVEVPAARWRPIAPGANVERAQVVYFVDGVRRVEAVVWITEDGQTKPRRGICASFAAGVVRASGHATIEAIEVRRGLFCAAGGVDGLTTSCGRFESMPAGGDDIDTLTLTLQQRLGELEVQVAGSLAADEGALVVVDGPLSGRQNVEGAVGYVKTHRVSYLPAELDAVVAQLVAGERSPLFVSTTSWTRYSWYARLPGPVDHPWSGVVRMEASGELGVPEASRLADLATRTLPDFASVPHKEPRAPQNLFPIGGLERELRRRLGDRLLVARALRVAAAGS